MKNINPYLANCPRCGSAVSMNISLDDRRLEHREYDVECRSCGLTEDCFPANGSGERRDAVREWNRWATQMCGQDRQFACS